jgi:hypothetical protein
VTATRHFSPAFQGAYFSTKQTPAARPQGFFDFATNVRTVSDMLPLPTQKANGAGTSMRRISHDTPGKEDRKLQAAAQALGMLAVALFWVSDLP